MDQYYDFIDWASKAMPWWVLKNTPYSTVYDQLYQGTTYYYYIMDQPLDELSGWGYIRNSLQYYEPFRSWVIEFTKKWGLYLSTQESWSKEYYEIVKKDDSFGLNQTWYESPDNWKSFNDFFTRKLRNIDQRKINSPKDSSVIVSPADSRAQGVWNIDSESNIILGEKHSEGINVKSVKIKTIHELLGENSAYKDSFENGTFTHMYLDVNDYHWYHFPLDGIIKHVEIITDSDNIGGMVDWDPKTNKYIFSCVNEGWQKIQTRGVVIVDTEKFGLVGIMPIGMSQVSSLTFDDHVKQGNTIKKGDSMGHFLFGGSDMILLFQKGVNFSLSVPFEKDGITYKHNLMGQ